MVDVNGSAEALTPRTGAPRLHCAACGRRRSIEILDSDLDLCTDGLNVRFAMGRARFASEGGAPNEDTRLTRGGVLTPREVQLHST